jgi:hypothetical protein
MRLEEFAFWGQAANSTGRAVLQGLGLVLGRWDWRGTKLVFCCAFFRRYFVCPVCWQHRPQREKFMPAWRASHGRQSQPAPHHGCNSRNFLRGDSLQLEVAANATSRIQEKPKRYGSRVKARLTSRATPREDTHGTEQIFGNGPPPRSPASPALTHWAVHRMFLEGPLRKRIGDAPCFGKSLSPPSHLTTYNGNRHAGLHSRSRPRGH